METEILLNESENVCTICLEQMEESIELPCQHRFHVGCLINLIKNAPSKSEFLCPNCRREIVIDIEIDTDEKSDQGEQEQTRPTIYYWKYARMCIIGYVFALISLHVSELFR